MTSKPKRHKSQSEPRSSATHSGNLSNSTRNKNQRFALSLITVNLNEAMFPHHTRSPVLPHPVHKSGCCCDGDLSWADSSTVSVMEIVVDMDGAFSRHGNSRSFRALPRTKFLGARPIPELITLAQVRLRHDLRQPRQNANSRILSTKHQHHQPVRPQFVLGCRNSASHGYVQSVSESSPRKIKRKRLTPNLRSATV